MEGTALPMTWLQFFVASAILSTLQMENRQEQWYGAASCAASSSKMEEAWKNVSLSALQLSFLEEVSHNCCMFVNSTPIFWQAPCRFAICSSVRQVGGSDRSVRYKGKYKIRWKVDRHIEKQIKNIDQIGTSDRSDR